LIAVRDELGLRVEKRFKEDAGQSGIPPTMLKVSDLLFLVGDALLTARDVTLCLLKMPKMHGPIHLALLALGGSTIGLSATDAYGTVPRPVMRR
jgi:hypothetical protein